MIIKAISLVIVMFFSGVSMGTASPFQSKFMSWVPDLFEGTVRLDNGITLRGEKTWEEDGLLNDRRAFAFYGYKYGTARRFEHSTENNDFSYLNDHTRPKLGPVCPHLQGIDPRNLTMNEDCLYLDVYLPPVKKHLQLKKWPVLYWIYGGGFKIGDKDTYDGSILARSIDSIVVTVNYRLGPFGFLSTSDSAAAGNYAIGDLKLALRWTLANIGSFNGDASKVTIAGQSAGSALTSALMLDDQVRGSVLASVSMSGSITHPWSLRKKPEDGAKRLALALDCPVERSIDLIACLKTRSVNSILTTSSGVLESGGDHGGKYFAPVIDRQHIPKDPIQILKDRALHRIPSARGRVGTFISGFMTDDTSLFLLTHPELVTASFNFTLVSHLITAFVAGENHDCPQNLPIQVQRILGHYNLQESSTPQQLRKGYYQVCTEAIYGSGSMEESILYSAIAPKNNHMYEISFDSDFMGLGAFHTLDVIHMFRGRFLESFMPGKISEPLTKALHDFFREITHNGRPDTGPAFGSKGSYEVLDQSAHWVTHEKDFKPIINFWKSIEALAQPAACPSHIHMRG